jgi:hypothetical protein
MFHKSATAFVHDLDALREILDPVMIMAYAVRTSAAKGHLDALQKFGALVTEDENKKTFDVPAEHLREVNRLAKKNFRAETANELLPKTFLVSFVSVYDAHIGRLIQAVLKIRPEILDQSDKVLSYRQLLELDTIDVARDRLIEGEIEAVLRQSHSDHFKWLENKCSMKLREGLPSWPVFVELTERRNLFVHTHGVVSSQYRAVCGLHKCAIDGAAIGAKLDAPKDYLISAYKCLYEIGVKLSQVLWRKLVPGEIEKADAALNAIAYELLVDEKYDLATRLLDFAVNMLPKHSADSYKRMFIVNLAQAYKFSGDNDGCQRLLQKYDWSSCSDDYVICLCVLRDDFEGAAAAMRRVGKTGAVKEEAYTDWPIFRKYREATEFKSAYVEVFGREPQSQRILDTKRREITNGQASDSNVSLEQSLAT